MKVLITGATGFIGSTVVKECLAQGIQVVAVDLFPFRDEALQNHPDVVFIQSEVTKDAIAQAINNEKPDAIASLAAVRPIGQFGFADYMKNIEISEMVMQACMETGLKNAIFISSRSVYSDDQMPWKETQANIAVNLYGESKNATDRLAMFYNKYNDMKFKCLRLAQVMGAMEKKGFLFNTLIDNANSGKTSTIYGTGCGRRQYIYVKDVANAIIHSCKHPEKEGIFNIGMDSNISIAELAQEIYRVFEDEGDFVFKPELPEDKNCYEMSVEKMKEELGFVPAYTLKTALQDIKKELNK